MVDDNLRLYGEVDLANAELVRPKVHEFAASTVTDVCVDCGE